MSLNHATKTLLESIRQRAEARLRDAALLLALRRLDVETPLAPPVDVDLDLDTQMAQPQLGTDAVLEATQHQAGTMAFDAWELLWSEFIEALIEHQECDYQGLGRFRFDSDKGVVQFRADPALNEGSLIRVSGEESIWSVAMVAATEGASIADRDGPMLVQPDSTHALSAVILSRIGPPSVRQAILRTTRELSADTAIATATFVSYQSLLLALGTHLKEFEKLDVPLIGVFSSSLGVVSFDASTELIDLLIANDRVSW
jgi:hypothetical protein